MSEDENLKMLIDKLTPMMDELISVGRATGLQVAASFTEAANAYRQAQETLGICAILRAWSTAQTNSDRNSILSPTMDSVEAETTHDALQKRLAVLAQRYANPPPSIDEIISAAMNNPNVKAAVAADQAGAAPDDAPPAEPETPPTT